MKIFESIKVVKPKTWFKSIWWLLLIVILICLLYPRIDSIQNGKAQPFDIFLFLILMSLLFIPLFQEVEFFGIKLKKELNKLKENIDFKFSNLSAEIKSTISVNPIFNFSPPTEEKLKNAEEKYKNTFASNRSEIKTTLDVPENNIYLFKIRFEIEKELRRILQKHKAGYEPIHAYNLSIILSELYNNQIISKDEANAMRDIIAICNYGIHNQPITPNQIRFVKEIGEDIISKLKTY